jgi:hypothetical protein
VKQDIAEKWVAALRSGLYHQTKDRLSDDQGFCCLGVLCDLSGTGRWEYGRLGKTYLGNDGLLPAEVRDWAGMSGALGEIAGEGRSLSQLNDNGYSFTTIADIIEREWEKL